MNNKKIFFTILILLTVSFIPKETQTNDLRLKEYFESSTENSEEKIEELKELVKYCRDNEELFYSTYVNSGVDSLFYDVNRAEEFISQQAQYNVDVLISYIKSELDMLVRIDGTDMDVNPDANSDIVALIKVANSLNKNDYSGEQLEAYERLIYESTFAQKTIIDGQDFGEDYDYSLFVLGELKYILKKLGVDEVEKYSPEVKVTSFLEKIIEEAESKDLTYILPYCKKEILSAIEYGNYLVNNEEGSIVDYIYKIEGASYRLNNAINNLVREDGKDMEKNSTYKSGKYVIELIKKINKLNPEDYQDKLQEYEELMKCSVSNQRFILEDRVDFTDNDALISILEELQFYCSQLGVNLTENTILHGDINLDGIVNSVDASMVLDIFKAGQEKMSTIYKICDINNDTIINSTDAALVLDYFKTETSVYVQI